MNQTVAIPAAQDLPDAPRQPRIPDSPFASFDVRIASEHDAPRLSLLLQQLGSADPRPDPALLAIQLQRPRGTGSPWWPSAASACSAPAPCI